MTSAVQPTTYKKRRPYHRPKRSTRNKTTINKESNHQQHILADPSPNELYNILVQAAEGYVKFNEGPNF